MFYHLYGHISLRTAAPRKPDAYATAHLSNKAQSHWVIPMQVVWNKTGHESSGLRLRSTTISLSAQTHQTHLQRHLPPKLHFMLPLTINTGNGTKQNSQTNHPYRRITSSKSTVHSKDTQNPHDCGQFLSIG